MSAMKLISVGTVLLACQSALAADEVVGALPTVKQGAAVAATALVVFAITAAFLMTVVWPKISKGLAEREAKIRSEIEAAENARAQAKASLEMYQKNLAEANSKAQAMIQEAKAQQQAQLVEMKTKAEAQMAMEKDKVMREIEAAKKQALAEIYTQTSGIATMVAGRILQREVNGADAEKFTLEAISSYK